MSMRGLPQAKNGGKMRRSSRKFTSASAIIGFVPVYALVAMAIAQTRPLQQASCIMQILCYAASAWP
ncbi:MAG: DUF2842 domain-containing protein, partial [Methylocella sp.]